MREGRRSIKQMKRLWRRTVADRPRYKGKHDRAGRFIAAVTRGQKDVVQELFEPRFGAAAIVCVEEPLFTYPLFCGSMYNDREDPATGRVLPNWDEQRAVWTWTSGSSRPEARVGWQRVLTPRSPRPGETALDVAYTNGYTAIAEFLFAWNARCNDVVQRRLLMRLFNDEAFSSRILAVRRVIYWPVMKLLLLAWRDGEDHSGIEKLSQLELQRIAQFLLGATVDTEDLRCLTLTGGPAGRVPH